MYRITQEPTNTMRPNTNYERVDALTRISDQVYPILEQKIRGEIRAKRIMRLGIKTVAVAMRSGSTLAEAGERFDSDLNHYLRRVDYGIYEPYRSIDRPLQHTVRLLQYTIRPRRDLGRLANRYADVERGTLLANLTPESDSIHAIHLAALATPYARAHYPDLQPGKVALYSLIHDLPEAYVGDTPTFKITHDELETKRQAEVQALARLRHDFGDKWPELIDALNDYESLANDEAAFVKTMDKNDPGYTHFRNDAHALKHEHGVETAEAFYNQARINTLRTLGYASRFALVLEDKDVLNERIAALFDNQNETTTITSKS